MGHRHCGAPSLRATANSSKFLEASYPSRIFLDPSSDDTREYAVVGVARQVWEVREVTTDHSACFPNKDSESELSVASAAVKYIRVSKAGSSYSHRDFCGGPQASHSGHNHSCCAAMTFPWHPLDVMW